MHKKLLTILFGMVFSLPIYAKYVTPLAGPGVEITRVFAHENGGMSLYISGSIVNLDECNTTFRVYIPHGLAGKDTLVSTALMAYASGKKIGLHASGCSTTSFWGASGGEVPIINNLWVF